MNSPKFFILSPDIVGMDNILYTSKTLLLAVLKTISHVYNERQNHIPEKHR